VPQNINQETIERVAGIKREARMAEFEGKELEDEKWRISLIRETLPRPTNNVVLIFLKLFLMLGY
jgi:hypothetical protein